MGYIFDRAKAFNNLRPIDWCELGGELGGELTLPPKSQLYRINF